jgi:hypothetical protein
MSPMERVVIDVLTEYSIKFKPKHNLIFKYESPTDIYLGYKVYITDSITGVEREMKLPHGTFIWHVYRKLDDMFSDDEDDGDECDNLFSL